MRMKAIHIARALVETIAASPHLSVDDACLSAIQLLKRSCPGTTNREFLRLVEREVKKQGTTTSGLLVVPHEYSLKAETIAPLLSEKTKKTVHIERKTEPELIGGAVLLIDHRRIDCSIQGALAVLLRTCLLPLD